jgi:hypothetical protein
VSESEWTIFYISIGGLVWLFASLVVARVLYWKTYRGNGWEVEDGVPAILVIFIAWPFIVMWLIVVWERKEE